MIVDLNEVTADRLFQADVCVVGAGAAGVALCRRLVELGRTVCLLEGGGFDYDAESQALYEGANLGMRYYDLVDSRLRFFGGTTNIWGGRCAVLDAMDFKRRDWVAHSGWPINEEDLAPYLEQVHGDLGLAGVAYDSSVWQELGESGPEIAGGDFTTQFWRFDDLKERFAAPRTRDLLDAPGVTVVIHGNLTHIQAAANAAAVEELHIGTLGGIRARVRAEHYVLACGGIENPRLLLAANDVEAAGIGNGQDQVGRYFMEHPHGRAGEILGSGGFSLWAAMRKRFRAHGPDLAPVLVPTPEAQQREGLLNTAFTVKLQRRPERGVPWSRQLYQSLKHSMAPTRHGRGLWHLYRWGRARAQQAFRMPLERVRSQLGLRRAYVLIRGEQAPNPASRVRLSSQRDALDVPLADLDWQLSAQDKHTVSAMMGMLDSELRRLGLGSAEPSQWLAEPGADWPVDPTVGNHPIGGYHHMGTTRMSEDPRRGVVDANCRVHGYGNLFVAGSSVFATGGWANPTLTILALSKRLGDHLNSRLGS